LLAYMHPKTNIWGATLQVCQEAEELIGQSKLEFSAC
jgi:hypothetical protein